MIHDNCFRQFTFISRNSGNDLRYTSCRLVQKSNTISSYIESVNQGGALVDDVTIVNDDDNVNGGGENDDEVEGIVVNTTNCSKKDNKSSNIKLLKLPNYRMKFNQLTTY